MGDNFLDGDYYRSDWANSGVLEADCLVCHLKGYDWKARAQAIQAGLFYKAPAMGAGWYRKDEGVHAAISPGKLEADLFALDYGRTAIADSANLAAAISAEVPDQNCCNCHILPDTIKRGRCWDADLDIHKAKGLSCTYCHTTENHEIAKGDIILGSVRDDIDAGMKGCADCHLKGADDRAPRPDHPFPDLHIKQMYCETCHIPYKGDSAVAVIDNATTGMSIRYSAKELSPSHLSVAGPSVLNCPDNCWLPAFVRYKGKIKPVNPMQVIWWGDWDKASHRVIPIILWRIRDFTGARVENNFSITNYTLLEALDGSKEVNTYQEIETYLNGLSKAKDRFGCPIISHTPVLVKGGMIYYLEFDELHKAPLPITEDAGFRCCEPFDLSHNVVGSNGLGSNGCKDCHARPSSFFNRKILLDPFDQKGRAVYKEAWEIMGYSKDRMMELSSPMISDP
ncbi:MAG: hypothetical protein ACOWYE_15760 [Desulfatiglandales bacterium]